MSTIKPRPGAFHLSRSRAGSRLLDALPTIAFALVILISVPTFPGTVGWMIDAFARGGNGARMGEHVPRLGRLTDVRGLGHYERLSVNKWASASHILPGRFLDPRGCQITANF